MRFDGYIRARPHEVRAGYTAVRMMGDVTVLFGGLLVGALLLARFSIEAVEAPARWRPPVDADADALVQPPSREGRCNIGAFMAELRAEEDAGP
jgi:hypothetical protein